MCRPQHEKLQHVQRRHSLGHVSAEVSLAKFLVVWTTKTWISCNYTLVSPHLPSSLRLRSSIAWSLPHAARLYTTNLGMVSLAPWHPGMRGYRATIIDMRHLRTRKVGTTWDLATFSTLAMTGSGQWLVQQYFDDFYAFVFQCHLQRIYIWVLFWFPMPP